jgi:hypothetical protein
MLPVATLLWLAQVAPQTIPAEILSRIAEEAGALQQNLPNAVTQETLEQRALLPPSRFRPSSSIGQPVTPRVLVRKVVSDYSVGSWKDSPSQVLVEYRQVVSVDGRAVQSEEKARHALSLGLKSLDDQLRKRMLEDLAKYGLVDVATDYGLILLEFTLRGQKDLQLSLAGRDQIGDEPALVLSWKQNSAEAGELEFIGRQAARHALEGRLWVRAADGVPLRVEAFAEHPQNQHQIRDEAAVDYTMTVRGFLAPAAVTHRHIVDRQVITENHYTYAPFKIFGADAEIKFDVPDSPPAKK